MPGLTGDGFNRLTYADLIERQQAKARELFGENVNLSERSPLGLIIRLFAWALALVWQLAEAVYNAAYVDTATGRDLDKVGRYIGITRRDATYATGVVTFTGTAGAGIDAGTIVSTEDDIMFYVPLNWQIPAGETTVDVDIVAVDVGTMYNVPPATITEILELVGDEDDISAVTNAAATSGGMEQETDAELRARYLVSVARGGASTIDSIRATLLDIEDVRAALVVENTTMEWDPGPEPTGQPPKSIECFVLGGEAADIGQAILETKAAGILAHGVETETVADEGGQEHDIGFTYADEVDIYVIAAVGGGAEFGENYDAVRTAIIQYIGGTDADGTVYSGLSMGEWVIHSRLIAACHSVPGVEEAGVYVGIAPAPDQEDNVVIAATEVAETNYAIVDVGAP